MSGAGAAVEHLAEPLDVDNRGGADWIHLVGCRRKDDLDALWFEQRAVGGKRARIARKILAGPELQWIDKYRYNDERGMPARAADEREVAFMQRAHSGYESDHAALDAGGAAGGLHFRDVVNDFHFFPESVLGW
jgi:hypothetical protein